MGSRRNQIKPEIRSLDQFTPPAPDRRGAWNPCRGFCGELFAFDFPGDESPVGNLLAKDEPKGVLDDRVGKPLPGSNKERQEGKMVLWGAPAFGPEDWQIYDRSEAELKINSCPAKPAWPRAKFL